MKHLFAFLCASFCFSTFNHASPLEFHDLDQNSMNQCTVIHAELENGMIIKRGPLGVELAGSFTTLGGAWDLHPSMSNAKFHQGLIKISPIKKLLFGEAITSQTRIAALENQYRQAERRWRAELAAYRLRQGI
jgi:hypothetical protein